MSTPFDPVDLLGSMRAPEGWDDVVELDGPRADPGALELFRSVVGLDPRARRGRRRHLRVVTGIVAVTTLGGVAAVAALALQRSPDTVESVSCWSESGRPPAAQLAVPWDGEGDPVEPCSSAWTDGPLGDAGPPDVLRACVTDDGITAVVPGTDGTCEVLGLAAYAPVEPDPEAEVDPSTVRALRDALAETIDGPGCRTADDAVAEVRRRLDESDLPDWRVEPLDTFGPDTPCASTVVDDVRRVVVVTSRRAPD